MMMGFSEFPKQIFKEKRNRIFSWLYTVIFFSLICIEECKDDFEVT